MGPLDRVVVLVDMDCFYCQVEEQLNPEIKDKPIAVVQYNAYRGGGIIAVNYPARNKGVQRFTRGDEAQEKCPDIVLCRVPELRGKADLTRYREAGKRVAAVLQTFTPLLERASVDEAYLDITEAVTNRLQTTNSINSDLNVKNMQNTHVVGQKTEDFIHNVKANPLFDEHNLKLAIGGLITEEIRRAVLEKTGYKCSAGIAHNKILAKLVCSLHKPNQQTIVPHDSVSELFAQTAVHKVRNLGGKFGTNLSEELSITTMAELSQFSQQTLIQKYDEKTGTWLYNIARGIDTEPVNPRLISKSIGCSKKFPGKSALVDEPTIQHWLNEFSEEIALRLDEDVVENQRKARLLVVSFAQTPMTNSRRDIHSSRSITLSSYEAKKLAQSAFDVVHKNCLRSNGTYCLTYLGMSAGNFQDLKNVREITSFFNRNASSEKPSCSTSKNDDNTNCSIYSMTTDEEIDENEQNTDLSPPLVQERSFFREYFTRTKPQTSTKSKIETTRICTECKQEIREDEFVSHQDFHLAMEMSRKQNDECASTKDSLSTNKKTTSGTSKKRKAIDEKQDLKTFFLKHTDHTENDENNSTVCSECGKRIKFEDLESHMDFHAAKKVHREINNRAPKQKQVQEKKTSVRKNTKMKPVKNLRSVTAFFKPI